ncbi:MAG: hypothetical protein AB8B73_10660 [Ekhidna sp.]
MKNIFTFFLLVVVSLAYSQPIPDTVYRVSVDQPLFENQKGPKVLIDEAHNNLHLKEGGLYAFTRMMEDDGAQVFANQNKFTPTVLEGYDVLIIANALNDSNVGSWRNPCPSAFISTEIDAIENWVLNGGRLFLVADHMPYGGAAQDLAKRFDVEWSNSFAIQNGRHWPPSIFDRNHNTLFDSPVTTDSKNTKGVSRIGSFTGSVFKAPSEAIPFLIYDNSHGILMPEIAWQFSEETKSENSEGWMQGACMSFGKGKMVLLGEAAMITAQLRGRTKIGMNSPDAPENGQLALNIFRYLSTD